MRYVCFLVLGLWPYVLVAAGPLEVRDWLGRRWSNELVMFDLDEARRASAMANQKLVDAAGNETAYQLVDGKLAVVVDLEPFATQAYTFSEESAKLETELQVEETDTVIRLMNGRAGIALPKKAPGLKQGPIAGIWLPDTGWVGGSWMDGRLEILAYSATVSCSGPVVAEVTCRADFVGGKSWEGIFRLQAGEPVALVDERFDVGGGARWGLALGRGFEPDHLQSRRSNGTAPGEAIVTTEEDRLIFKWQPWPLWGPSRTGKWFGLYREDGEELLVVGARNSESWVDLRHPRDETVRIERLAGEVTALLPLDHGRRSWLIGAFPKKDCFPGKGESPTPLSQQPVIKYEFPLNRIKDYVLSWPDQEVPHPRLFTSPETVEAHRAGPRPEQAELDRLAATPVSMYDLDAWISPYLVTLDPGLGRHLAAQALEWMQAAVDIQIKQERIASFGWSPHAQMEIPVALSAADAVLASAVLTPRERERVRAQAASLGYTVMRSDFWSPLRGFAANPNMTSHVACYQVLLGCFLPTHPEAGNWVREGLRELKDVELDTWSDANGGWIEAPGYALVSLNYIVGAFLAARHSGYADLVNDERLKRVFAWLAKISTPPDARLLGTRYLIPLGNTWKMAWCGEFGLAAALWKESDPEFAAEMAWMHRQHHSYMSKVGGFPGVMAGYRNWLIEPVETITPQAPAYGSELFPETGVVLRSHFPSDRETMLYLIAGENCHHYDFDSGSVTIWGKGRIVADEFGYYDRAPAADHSMLEIPVHNNAIMRTRQFATTRMLDYVLASLAKEPPGDVSRMTEMIHLDYQHSVYNDWTRQIAMVKDEDPLGPNYFVINDSLRSPVPATWRMWFTCREVKVKPHGALVVGCEDVDTDIFFAWPPEPNLTTEVKTRTTSGYNTEAAYGRWDWTQTGLIADLDPGLGFLAVIFPRLKEQAAPRMTTLADGRGVKVESDAGTDYVFLSAKPFTFGSGQLSFSGTNGLVQIRGKMLKLALGAKGRIAFGEHSLESETASNQVW